MAKKLLFLEGREINLNSKSKFFKLQLLMGLGDPTILFKDKLTVRDYGSHVMTLIILARHCTIVQGETAIK